MQRCNYQSGRYFQHYLDATKLLKESNLRDMWKLKAIN